MLAKADSDTQDMIREGIAANKAEKTRLVNTITANARNVFTAEQLQGKKLDELKAIAKLATQSDRELTPRFDGQGETVANESIGELPIPQPVLLAENKKE